MKFSTNFTF